MMLPNYLEELDDSINIFGIGELLKKAHFKYGKDIREEFKGKIHFSLYYYWLSNQSPIKIKHLRTFKKYEKNIVEDIFKKSILFSAGNKKVILPKEFTEDLAYLIGAFHGDGHISKNLRNMDLTEEDLRYHKIIKKLFKKIFNVDGHIAERKDRKNIYYRSTVSSKVVSSFFRLYCPIEKKKGRLIIPDIIKKNKQLLTAYLSGFFDTDGCLSDVKKKKFYFIFSQADKKIVYDVYRSLNILGLKINKPKPTKNQSAPYSGDRNSVLWRIAIGSKKTLKDFLSIIEFRHPLKEKRANKMKKVLGLWSSSYDATLTN